MFEGRREFLFLYSVKDGNPNGDPLNANYPRYDEETQQVLASDVRIKRTIRDQFIRKGEAVFIDGETKTLKTRFEELKSQFKTKTGEETMKKCIDVRLFGVTFALKKDEESSTSKKDEESSAVRKKSFAWTGPVQFKWARSLNKAKVDFVQGSGGFSTKDGSENRTFRNEYKVPFAIMATYAIANQNASKITEATDEDLMKMREALWNGTNNLITRSKTEHRSKLIIEIEYKPGFESHIGSLDEKVTIVKNDGSSFDDDEQLAIRNLKDFVIDLSEIAENIRRIKDNVKNVRVYVDSGMNLKGLEDLDSKTLNLDIFIEKR